jgi:hypothetical protein
MSNREAPAKRVRVAVGSRAAGGEPAGRTAIRAKPVRITLDLDPATYKDLNRWVGSAAVAVNPDHPRLSLAQTLRAMIHATTADTVVAGVVVDLLRRDQEIPR